MAKLAQSSLELLDSKIYKVVTFKNKHSNITIETYGAFQILDRYSLAFQNPVNFRKSYRAFELNPKITISKQRSPHSELLKTLHLNHRTVQLWTNLSSNAGKKLLKNFCRAC